MARSRDLRGAAVRDRARRFIRRAAERLHFDRGALLVAERAQARSAKNFALMTWLVIR